MSLVTQIQNLATRIGTEINLVKASIGPLTSLTTTNKTSTVNAINEVRQTALDAASNAGASTLDDLSDVVVSSPSSGHIIRHNGTNFINVAGTAHFDSAGSAAAAQAASQPLNAQLTAIAGLTQTEYGQGFLTLADAAALMARISQGTTTTAGKLQLATNAETVTGTDTAKATTSAGTKAAIDARIINDSTLGGASPSTTNAPSVAAVKAYADALIGSNDAMVYKGTIDASTNPNYPASNRGDTYRISVAGRIGGASGPVVEVGDILMALTDGTASGTHAAVGAQWNITQTNIDGAVIGPASATNNNLAVFSGATGKVIADSGIATETSITNSNTKVPTSAAVMAYGQPKDATLTGIAGVTTAADQLIYSTGVDAFAATPLTVFARSLLDDATASAARTTLDVYGTADIGDPNTNFVTTFETALAAS